MPVVAGWPSHFTGSGVDEQVKIRGYRVEPGEIESTVLSLDGIKGAKVIVAEKEGTANRSLQVYLEIDNKKFPLLGNYLTLLG